MTQGDALVAALGATMALILARRALRAMNLSWKATAWMVIAWVVLIGAVAIIAAWWQR